MKSIVGPLLIVIGVALVSEDAFAQRRGGRRGSVRYATPDGNYSRNTQRGGRVDYSKNRSGNTRSESATLTGRGGESVSGSRDVSRDGDTLTVDKQAQSSRGGSRESSKEIEFDDGRVDSVERESKTTGRYGESVERSGSAEREGYRSFEFEGEAKTSTGREADVEGVLGVNTVNAGVVEFHPVADGAGDDGEGRLVELDEVGSLGGHGLELRVDDVGELPGQLQPVLVGLPGPDVYADGQGAGTGDLEGF